MFCHDATTLGSFCRTSLREIFVRISSATQVLEELLAQGSPVEEKLESRSAVDVRNA